MTTATITPTTSADDVLSITFAALADPTRRAILARLATGDATVNELAEPFTISLQAVSKHLRVLEQAQLISRSKDAQFRPCRLEGDRLDPAVDWIARHRTVWESRLDRLEVHLRNIQNPTHELHRATPKSKQRSTTTKETKQ